MTDDFSGYHALHSQGVTAALCMAHARRKLFEAHQFNGSEIAGQAVALIAKLYEIEREARELEPEARLLLRQQRSKPVAEALHAWLSEQRQKLAKADVTAKAIDYSLSNWRALTRYLDDGHVPIDNNAAENAVRPLASVARTGYSWDRSRPASAPRCVLSLIESAKLNGHDPWAYLKDVFERLPTLKQRDLAQLLPHNWRPPSNAAAPTPRSPPSPTPRRPTLNTPSSTPRMGSRNAYDQRAGPGHGLAAVDVLRGEAAQAPLVLQLVEGVLRIGAVPVELPDGLQLGRPRP